MSEAITAPPQEPFYRVWLRCYLAAADSVWFSVLSILLLHFHVLWGFWRYRDLTSGDTIGYYAMGLRWAQDGMLNVNWSPLYTVFYGMVYSAVGDPFLATGFHRLIIVLVVGLLVLAVARHLLSTGCAWLVAAWWAVLPINFNTLYEVHLFAVIPILLTWLVLLRWRNTWGRGLALGMLFTTSLLVRNEYTVSTMAMAGVLALVEVRAAQTWTRRGFLRLCVAYSLPLLLTGLLYAGAYSRSIVKGKDLIEGMHAKHTVNMAQTYCAAYLDRHKHYTDCPWTSYGRLMKEHFGKERPTMSEMLWANPKAVLKHYAYTLSLTPNGLQVLLFDACYGKRNPDYPPVNSGRVYPLVLSAGVMGVWVLGPFVWWRRWRSGLVEKQQEADRSNWVIWLCMACVLVPVPLIIVTQRPRPSYLFPLSVFVMLGTASWLALLCRRWLSARWLAATIPLTLVAVCWFLRPHFLPQGPHPIPRFVHDVIARLEPFRLYINEPNAVFIKGQFAPDVGAYLAGNPNLAKNYNMLRDDWAGKEPLGDYLAKKNVTLFYIDHALLHDLEANHNKTAASFISNTDPPGWELLAQSKVPHDRWRLYHRRP